jgi:hypothetical protein
MRNRVGVDKIPSVLWRKYLIEKGEELIPLAMPLYR